MRAPPGLPPPLACALPRSALPRAVLTPDPTPWQSTPAMCRTVRFLNQAAEEAERSELDIKHGALLVRNGKVIGSGHNSSRTRLSAVPGAFPGVSMHSEVAALHSAVPYVL